MGRHERTEPKRGPRGLRLPEDLESSIGREAEARGRSWSSMATELLDEAVRVRRAPGIIFVDGASGRRAAIAGTGIDVWEVVAAWIELDRDFTKLAENYPWLSEMQLRSALGYYQLYPAEVDARLEIEASWTPERVARELPHSIPHLPRG